ncbi:PKD domain-containing protein, partial [Alcanivorax xiamenensis]|uniref:PKD domain-containing protein n=1 Tax=Alcanivorax xiamenensis TaxID=1177156 RepID=UPI0019160F0A
VGSAAELSDEAGAQPTFTADLPGTYEADLVVNDGTADSGHDAVTIIATNPDPVAIAETEYHVLIGTTVMLDGSGSVPPTGGDTTQLVYNWSLQDLPTGSTAALAQTGTGLTSFYADMAGTYTAILTVGYQEKISAPLTVTIIASTANTKPVADAGGPYTIERGQTLTLDGNGSSDADGNPLTYRWYLFPPSYTAREVTAQKPAGSLLTVENALVDYDTATPSITPDVVGKWTAYLVVHDGVSISESSATIDVTLPDGAENTPPVATWFGEPHVSFYEGSYSNEVELGTTIWASGNSYDADGGCCGSSNRRYSWISTPEGYVQEDQTGKGSFWFTPDVPGAYTVEMIVNDGEDDSAPKQRTFTARTGANEAPRAALAVDSGTVLVGDTAWFDGRDSSDPNDDPLEYIWTLFDKPDGSSAKLTFQNVTSDDGAVLVNARAGIVTDQPGAYVVMLAVRDSHGVTNRPTTLIYGKVLAKSENNPPETNPTARLATNRINPLYPYLGMDETQPLVTGQQAYLASNAIDPDLDALYYLWTMDKKPEGSTATEAGDREYFMFLADLPGTYQVTLVVSDGVATSEPYTLTIPVVTPENYPTLRLIQGDQSYIVDGSSGSSQGAVPPDLATMDIDQGGSMTLPYSNTFPDSGALTRLWALTASKGDYTIVDLNVTTEHGGTEQARLVGLTEGQVIKEGETVNFALVYPADFNIRESGGDFRWQFKIKEREDFFFDFHYDKEQVPLP